MHIVHPYTPTMPRLKPLGGCFFMACLLAGSVLFGSCHSENYSNGERIGVITQFSHTGIFWKSWEGHLNATQTGMNSSVPFDFSIDNDNEPAQVISTIDSAAQYGWKVKLKYHETFNKNWFRNRGETDHFITTVEVLDRAMATMFSPGAADTTAGVKYRVQSVKTGRNDTITIIIERK